MPKILHIVAGLPPEGGISQSVLELCRHLKAEDVSVKLVTTGSEISQAAIRANKGGVELVVCRPSWPPQLYFSVEMLRKLPARIKAADVVHVHSQWTFPVWWGCHLALRYNKPLIMTPHGCLAPERLKISNYKKRLAGWLFDRRYLRRASVIHATCEREAEDIRAYQESSKVETDFKESFSRISLRKELRLDKEGASGFAKGYALTGKAQRKVGASSLTHGLPRIVVIPNGIDLEAFDAVGADRVFVDSQWPECRDKKIALFLSRIHPIKGLENLIEAWYGGNDWLLVIAGSGDKKYIQKLSRQVDEAGLSVSIKFIGPVFGEVKVKLMKAAEVFILPTRNENFGIVVAEALACGTPVITTKGAPWSELLGKYASVEDRFARQGASGFAKGYALTGKAQSNELTNLCTNALPQSGWWIDHGVDPLATALQEAMALSDAERKAMGTNGRKLVEAKYQWRAIAKQMQEVYKQTKTSV